MVKLKSIKLAWKNPMLSPIQLRKRFLWCSFVILAFVSITVFGGQGQAPSEPAYGLFAIVANEAAHLAGESYFARITPDGADILATLDHDDFFAMVSPDRTLVAVVTSDVTTREESILFLNRLGQVVHSFRIYTREISEYWLSVWGWLDNQTLVISNSEEHAIGFFRLHLGDGAPTWEAWNGFAVLPFSLQEIDGPSGSMAMATRWFYRFNPSFDYFVSPIPLNGTLGELRHEHMYLYANETPRQKHLLSRQVWPWYFSPQTSLSLSWANYTPTFAFTAFYPKFTFDCGPDLFLFSLPAETQTLLDIECGNIALFPTYVTWSPDDTKIAYWLRPFSTVDNPYESSLRILQIDNQQTETVYRSQLNLTFAGLRWSPDGTQIGFATDHKSNSSQIHVFQTDSTSEQPVWQTTMDYDVHWLDWMLISAQQDS
jgi:hypothetical protein